MPLQVLQQVGRCRGGQGGGRGGADQGGGEAEAELVMI